MSAADDKPGNKPPQGTHDDAARDRAARDGVRHDARGNAVWQWAVDTGKHAIDSTSRLLKRLEVPGLSLEDDGTTPGAKPDAGKAAPPGAGPATGAAATGAAAAPGASAGAGPARGAAKPERAAGYDPYGTRAGAKGSAARPAAPPVVAVRKPVAAPPARPSFWRRLFRRG